MTGRVSSAPEPWFRSGLDTSNGAAFIQQRLALFAKVISLVSLAFLSINMIVGALFGMPLGLMLSAPTTIANLLGLGLITAVWLVCRRGRHSVSRMAMLDAIGLVGSCTAWAFFLNRSLPESVFGAVISVSMTTLARATIVPSRVRRTFTLSLLAITPVAILMWLWLESFAGQSTAPFEAYGPWLTVINQSLVLLVVLALATITSRILYDLRRRVREANELGQYSLEERLGAGGMGEVWRARHRFLVRAAAIKLIRPELLALSNTNPEVLLRRFEREAMATAALRSPHTVQLYDFGQADDGTLFYVMELLLGIDLERLVSLYGPVPPERAIHILKQVCHSLEEAHQNGLTHRDIKPANIFVTGTGTELDFVKVLDFGLVRLRPAQSSGPVHLTNEDTVGGTPAFAAPEIVMAETGYDHRVDIYAVGCVGYWLLTGKLVFEASNPMAMLVEHARTPAPRLSGRTELAVPADLEQVIMECLEKDPARRPASAGELARQLGACMVERGWTPDRAERWWLTHMPSPVEERPVADVLLSREGSAGGGLALRPVRRFGEKAAGKTA
jgi:eukaryotic-like serine/threonine-protein kinase